MFVPVTSQKHQFNKLTFYFTLVCHKMASFIAVVSFKAKTYFCTQLEEFEFSQAYLFFWDKLERANYFLNTIVDLYRLCYTCFSRNNTMHNIYGSFLSKILQQVPTCLYFNEIIISCHSVRLRISVTLRSTARLQNDCKFCTNYSIFIYV